VSEFTGDCGDPRCLVCRHNRLPSIFPGQARREAREAWERLRREMADPYRYRKVERP